MKLTDLDPKWTKGGTLALDCPRCRTHRVKIDARWHTVGNFETMKVTPLTIIATCNYVFGIRGGEIVKLERVNIEEQFKVRK